MRRIPLATISLRAPPAATRLLAAGLSMLPVLAMAFPAIAQEKPAAPTANTVVMPATPLPYTRFASPEARAQFERMLAETREGKGPNPADVADQRRFYQRYNDDRLAEAERRYPTKVEATRMGEVPVHVVDPQAGAQGDNARRVLINLHGGAFMWGSGSGALVEAVPIAAVSGIRVVTVDYRLAPEHPYPAAVDDVEAVYRALLKQYRAENIGIYGCSAGGMLTAQATARILSRGLPRPGAVGNFCGTGLLFAGDSATLGQLAVGVPPLQSDGGASLPYLRTARADDPVAFPGQSPEMLAKFPPTLFLAGGRDFAVSALSTMQRRLLAAGVEADLVLFDGLWHAFFVYPDLPESQEAYGVIARFFDRHLGRKPR
ncbi:alpha/beta hydrolase [Pseudoxanthomonas sp.]|uniref:alpha/beta hydrolase n=1 Tax=Pseudoxanthomonas sp. TaxID=1871049 RepID=UPI003F804E09